MLKTGSSVSVPYLKQLQVTDEFLMCHARDQVNYALQSYGAQYSLV